MDSEKIEKLRERLLQCAVCMEEFKDPRILPCHHTLCMECIQKLSESSPSYAGFSCPHCRSNVPVPLRGIRDLPINFYIINLQEELSTTGYTEKCNICERDWLISQFRCVDCDLDICRFCIHAHRLETHTEPPTILRIETKASHFQYASNRFCLEHTDEILQMYCSTCCQAICITCSCNDHKKHVVVPIALKLQESKTYLQSELDRLTSEKASATKVSDSLKNTLAGVTESSSRSLMTLDSATLRAYRMLLKKQHDIEKKILQSEKEQVDNIVSVMKECDLYSKRINNALAFLTDLQESDICLELLDTYKDFFDKSGVYA